MKRVILSFFVLGLTCSLVGCSETTPTSNLPTNATTGTTVAKEPGTVDIDLTLLSNAVAFGEMYQMMFYPEEYEGKTIQIAGEFFIYTNPDTGENYYTVVLVDELLCCAQGLEFILPSGATYPTLGEQIKVLGVFETYEEYGYTNFRLENAQIVEKL